MPLTFDFSKIPGTNDPWGPSTDVPESLRFNDVPYAPFSKTDKLGKVADWQQTREDEPKRYQEKRRDQYHAYGASAAKLFGAEAEDEDFSIVDNNNSAAPVNKQAVLRGRRGTQQHREEGGNRRFEGGNRGNASAPNARYNNNNNNQGGNQGGNRGGYSGWGNRGGWRNNSRYGNRFYNREEQNKNRTPSIKVEPEWKHVTEIELSKLTKLNLVVGKPEVLASYGTLNQYNKKYDLFRPEVLKPSPEIPAGPTASKDPLLQQYASAGGATVFATDVALAQLMCAVRSAYSWDIEVTKKNGVIYFDKRAGTNTLEVDENASWSPTETDKVEMNRSTKLAEEAARVNASFLETALETSTLKLEHPESLFGASRGYRYVKYSLPTDDSEKPLNLILRAQVDGFQTDGKLVSINTLNQYNPTVADDWKVKLVSGSRGVIFAGELKKNNNKIARWTTQAVLGGLDSIKLGFVSRKSPKDNTSHVVAGAVSFTPDVLSSQIRLSVGNGWGIVKSLIDIIDHEGGDQDYKFVIFRAPGVSKINVYQVPLETFADEM